jgi:hypothetical protein
MVHIVQFTKTDIPLSTLHCLQVETERDFGYSKYTPKKMGNHLFGLDLINRLSIYYIYHYDEITTL